jgi:putative mRNA 3-end processing factor
VARRSRTAPVIPVTWRDGVHLTGTPIWCDARRRRDVCFLSSAERAATDASRRVGHGQLIATPLTLALIGADAGQLGVPVHRPFTLGTTRLELIPSGRGLGAAALHVDLGGRSVLYAGSVRTVNPREAAEVRAADAVVVAASLGEPEHQVAALDDVAAEVIAWTRAQLTLARIPVLVVDTTFDGIEVATYLAAAGIHVAASRSLRDAAQRATAHTQVPALRAPGREPACVIRVEGDRVKLADGIQAASALVSLRAITEGAVDDGVRATLPGWEAAFAWPFAATREQLLQWIEQARAKDVFVTGPFAETIAEAVGPRARTLGPPRQMALFGS